MYFAMNVFRYVLFLSVLHLSVYVEGQDGSILKNRGINKLSVFLGTWKGENKPGSENNTTAVTRCVWSLNGRYLVCDQLIDQADGQTNNLSIYSYDSLHDSYALSVVGIPNMDPFAIPVTIHSDTLFYTGSYIDNGKKFFTRTLNIFKSSSFYIFISQYSADGSSWTNTSEGSASKSEQ